MAVLARRRLRAASAVRPAPPVGTFPQLDVLRGFAAVSVIVYHTNELGHWTTFPITGTAALWFRLGWMSVPLFFVISGFVITLSAVRQQEVSPGMWHARRAFMGRRFARIAPLHYLTCLLFLIFLVPQLMAFGVWPRQVLSHLFFVHNLHPSTHGGLNGPNWSIGVEMQFYILMAILLPWLTKVRPLTILAAAVTFTWAYRAAVFAFCHDRTHPYVNLTWMYTSQLLGSLDLFAFGIALGLLVARDSSGNVRRWLARWWLWAALGLAVAVPLMGIYWRNATYWNHNGMVVFWMTGLGVVWALLIACACGLNSPWMVKLTAPLRYLGTISYGLYLWHSLVLTAILKTTLVAHPKTLLATTLGLTALLAAGSWHFFEKPFLQKRPGREEKGSG